MRVLPSGERQEGRGLDAVLSPIGSLTQSNTQTFIFLRRNKVVNRSNLVRALITVASVFLPFAGHGDTATRGRGNADAAQSVVGRNGNIHVPENYRVEYQFLGTWAVAADGGRGSKEIHVVFASPGAAEG